MHAEYSKSPGKGRIYVRTNIEIVIIHKIFFVLFKTKFTWTKKLSDIARLCILDLEAIKFCFVYIADSSILWQNLFR